MRAIRPLIAVLVGVGVIVVGYMKEYTDTVFNYIDLYGDIVGTCIGVMLFFLLVHKRCKDFT